MLAHLPRLAALAALLLPLCSCATIMTGTTDTVLVQSEPPGASFTTNTGHSGTTPGEIEIPDAVTLQVDYELAGHEPASLTLEPRTSAWLWGNALIGGLIGLAIDLIGGAEKTHDDEASVVLTPIEV